MNQKLETFYCQTKKLLKNHNIDDEILCNLNYTADLLKKKSRQEIEYLK